MASGLRPDGGGVLVQRVWCLLTVATVAFFDVSSAAIVSGPAEPALSDGSIAFADSHSRARWDEYRAFLGSDPKRYADEIATVATLERSDVRYVIAIVGSLGNTVEGKISTDGQSVILSICNVGGPAAEVASLNSRFAHELEHARQFDAGELGLACDPASGRWASHYGSYDIGDEVKAWEAQLHASTTPDYWTNRGGTWRPTLLRLFADAKTDAERARVLVQHGYPNVNPDLQQQRALRRGLRLSRWTGGAA